MSEHKIHTGRPLYKKTTMHLRSGKVTPSLPSLPWPRPSDVKVKQFPTSDDMTRFFMNRLQWGDSNSLTKRRRALIEIVETLFENYHLLEINLSYYNLIYTIIQKFESDNLYITTFNQDFYMKRLRTLIGCEFIERRARALKTIRPAMIEWACRPHGPIYRVAEKRFHENVTV
jgi:hypothetical protein